jgi:hypothetical protein
MSARRFNLGGGNVLLATPEPLFFRVDANGKQHPVSPETLLALLNKAGIGVITFSKEQANVPTV